MDISYSKDGGLKVKTKTGMVSIESDRLVMSHRKSDEGDFVVSGAGEYEVEGISVFGYPVGSQTIYVIQGEDVRVLWAGQLESKIEEKLMGELENIDVVAFEMVEGKLGSKEWVEMVGVLEPYYVVPLGHNASFITSYEHGSRSVKSLSISRLSLTDEVTEVIVFE